jgi:hypothetical protein
MLTDIGRRRNVKQDEHLLGVEGTAQADGTLYLQCNLG